MRSVILVFVKYPEPGRVKTRLAASIGPAAAADAYRRMAAHVCAMLPAQWDVRVMYDPPERRAEIEHWLRPLLPSGAAFFPQAAGDLGARLDAAFSGAFAAGFESVAAIGTDCVEMNGALFEETRFSLESTDCVIGPAEDGGYYLIALKAHCPALFDEVEWSSAQTFEQTMSQARRAGLSVRLLKPLGDVDTEEDWQDAQRHLGSADPEPES